MTSLFVTHRHSDCPDMVKFIHEPRWEIFCDYDRTPLSDPFPDRLKEQMISATAVRSSDSIRKSKLNIPSRLTAVIGKNFTMNSALPRLVLLGAILLCFDLGLARADDWPSISWSEPRRYLPPRRVSAAAAAAGPSYSSVAIANGRVLTIGLLPRRGRKTRSKKQ